MHVRPTRSCVGRARLGFRFFIRVRVCVFSRLIIPVSLFTAGYASLSLTTERPAGALGRHLCFITTYVRVTTWIYVVVQQQ